MNKNCRAPKKPYTPKICTCKGPSSEGGGYLSGHFKCTFCRLKSEQAQKDALTSLQTLVDSNT